MQSVILKMLLGFFFLSILAEESRAAPKPKSSEVKKYQESKPKPAPTGYHARRGRQSAQTSESEDCDCIVTLDSVVPSIDGDLLTYCEPAKYNGCRVRPYVPKQKMVEENKQVGTIGTGPIRKVFRRKWLNGVGMTLRVVEVPDSAGKN